jgi:hypothetical protein
MHFYLHTVYRVLYETENDVVGIRIRTVVGNFETVCDILAFR